MSIKNRYGSVSLLALLFYAICLVIGVGVALASDDTYRAVRSPVVKENGVYELGTIMATFTAGQLQVNDVLTFRLPQDFIWTTAPLKAGQDTAIANRQGTDDWNNMTVTSEYVRYGTANYIQVPKRYSGDDNGLFQGDAPVLEFSTLGDNEVRMEITRNITPDKECVFYLYARRVYVPGGFTGQIPVVFDAPSNSGFATGTVSPGRISGSASNQATAPVTEANQMPVVNNPPTEDKVQATFTVGKSVFLLKGVEISMDVAPYLKEGRTYLPIRYAAQALGIDESCIEWDEDRKSVVINSEGHIVKLTVGNGIMSVDGQPVIMDAPPELLSPGRVMVPIRWIAEALGTKIQWDPVSNIITVEKTTNLNPQSQ